MTAENDAPIAYAAAARLVWMDAEKLAERTRERLELRGPQGRELSNSSRLALNQTADALDATAGNLRELARKRAALNRYASRILESLQP